MPPSDAWQAKDSYVLVDGCLFEGNYANNKGGAIHHEDKRISVVGSVFYDNVAGSESVEDSESCIESHATVGVDQYGGRGIPCRASLFSRSGE